MQCHRQETSGKPYADATATAGDFTTSHPGMYVKVGPYHNSIIPVSHPHANQWLNSPHGQFSGTFDQVATATYNNGYASHLQVSGEASEARNTGAGCTSCHNPHKSTVETVGADEPVKECTECHAGPYGKPINKIRHAGGPGTPLENASTDPASACETCHMPGGLHLFRINTNPVYATYPASALNGIVNATAQPAGAFTNAVWVDLDLACGQCHGGGTAQATTTGNTTSGSPTVTVASATGLYVGGRVNIAGAGGLSSDGVTHEDLESYIKTIAGTTITLVGNTSATLTGTAVVQNPTKNGASYKTKQALAGPRWRHAQRQDVRAAEPDVQLHGQPASRSTSTRRATTCSDGTSASCSLYTWNWGDMTANGTGVSTSHTYASSGAKSITLTVEEYGVSGGTKTKIVTLYTPDTSPVASGTCTFGSEHLDCHRHRYLDG